jgi:hypothetical protein
VLPGWRVDVDAHENLILTRANSKA